MSLHKLEAGRNLIDGLVTLGQGLGYYVSLESPVRKSGQNRPAVDVAWMADQFQEFPLMIFEVETSAGNTIANNALKVFGQPAEQFEKPLFFFHAILDSGRNSSRIEDLRSHFGLHNYRVYCLDQDEKTKLVLDIMAQHRRLKREVDLLLLYSLLSHAAWVGVDPRVVMVELEKLQFRAGFLNAYAIMARIEASFVDAFVQRLASQEGAPRDAREPHGYKTYIGDRCPRLVHIAVLSRAFPERRQSLFEALRRWQEAPPLMPQITPHFGLSSEYDDFLFCMAAGLLGVVAGVFGDHGEARTYLAGLVHSLLKEMVNSPREVGFYSATWLLHISSALPDPEAFAFARDFINNRGGIDHQCLLNPPFQIPRNLDFDPKDSPWLGRLCKRGVSVPERSEFRNLVRSRHPPLTGVNEAILVGLVLLTEPENLDMIANETLRLLSAPL